MRKRRTPDIFVAASDTMLAAVFTSVAVQFRNVAAPLTASEYAPHYDSNNGSILLKCYGINIGY